MGDALDPFHVVANNDLMTRAQRLIGTAFLPALVAMLAVIAPSPASSQEAAAILGKMAETYVGLRSYQDKGSVRYDILGAQQEVTFKTAFVRPDRFRFEWTKHHPFALARFVKTTSVIRFDGAKAYTWKKYYLENPTEEQEESLALAVAGATGVSSGSAHRIATLLIPDLWKENPVGSAVSELGDSKIVGVESIDGVDCFRVSGTRRGEPMDLWIGRSDYLLRKIEYLLKGNKNVELRQSIVVNQEVPLKLFSSAVEN